MIGDLFKGGLGFCALFLAGGGLLFRNVNILGITWNDATQYWTAGIGFIVGVVLMFRFHPLACTTKKD